MVTEVTALGLMGNGLILKIHVFISKSTEVSRFVFQKYHSNCYIKDRLVEGLRAKGAV